jgi:quinoprotein glucose dehydrogenase
MKRSNVYWALLPAAVAAIALLSPARSSEHDWPAYGGGPDVIRYSTLDQVNRSNVGNLKVAWTYDFGDSFADSQIESSPVVVGNVLYAISPRAAVAALDAASGKQLWRFNPVAGGQGSSRTRGVSYWSDHNEARVFTVYQEWLYSLDARTGKPAPEFGTGGRIDLRAGLGRPPGSLEVTLTTPGVIYKDLLIIGSTVAEDLPAAPGDIRAYDVHTGKMRWIFHTIPHPGEFGYKTWPPDAWKQSGGANDWAGMALDTARGMVFVPTGSPSFDFYGKDRHGDDLFANCLLALRADSGQRVWHFQFVRHDLWDRDLPAAPSLVTVKQGGRTIDAVAQTTKSGYVFVFDRDTGKPVFPIVYGEVAPSDVDGELAAETQPLPLKPPPFARQELTESLLTQRTPQVHAEALARFRTLRSGPQFTPPSLQGTIFLPGLDGGGTWGGAAFDPQSSLLYVNANEMPWILQLGKRPAPADITNAGQLYASRCAPCHGTNRRGSPPDVPSLVGITSSHSAAELRQVIRNGRGRMPSFGSLDQAEVQVLIRYISSGEDRELFSKSSATTPLLKYRAQVNSKFLDSDGYPAIKPPWGTLNAIDLNKGEIRWQIPLGEVPALAAQGMTNTGTANFGGPVVTAGGLVFIGATTYDQKFRAFDKATGKLCWETKLPAANFAAPAIYEINGRQYIAVSAGGGRGTPSSGKYVAFALP